MKTDVLLLTILAYAFPASAMEPYSPTREQYQIIAAAALAKTSPPTKTMSLSLNNRADAQSHLNTQDEKITSEMQYHRTLTSSISDLTEHKVLTWNDLTFGRPKFMIQITGLPYELNPECVVVNQNVIQQN